MENQKFFGSFKKNQAFDVRVSLIEEDDFTQIDIRQWFVDRDEDPVATKKGVRFDISHNETLQEALAAIARYIKEKSEGSTAEP